MGIMNKMLKKTITMRGNIYSNIIYINDHINIVHNACKLCYNSTSEADRQKKLKYIEDKVRLGHESVLEHSNVIIHLIVPKNSHIVDLANVLAHTKYLNIVCNDNKEREELDILIGGSIRGYKHIFRNIKDQNNVVLNHIKNLMYLLPKEYFYDFIQDEIFEESKFKEVELEDSSNRISTSNENTKIENIDYVKEIYSKIKDTFTISDVLKVASITIKIEDISRVISQQLTRHRCAISQMSQRYVDHSNKTIFIDPTQFKKDKYDRDKEYSIVLKTDKEEIKISGTAQYIGDLLNSAYPSLKEQGMLKEDARSYLLNNTPTSLYMTFTLFNFIKFLELRTDKAAQAEVRERAIILEEALKKYLDCEEQFNIYDELIPQYKKKRDVYNAMSESMEQGIITMEQFKESLGLSDLD